MDRKKNEKLYKKMQKCVKTYSWKDKQSLLMLSSVPEQSDEFKATEKIQ